MILAGALARNCIQWLSGPLLEFEGWGNWNRLVRRGARAPPGAPIRRKDRTTKVQTLRLVRSRAGKRLELLRRSRVEGYGKKVKESSLWIGGADKHRTDVLNDDGDLAVLGKEELSLGYTPTRQASEIRKPFQAGRRQDNDRRRMLFRQI